MRRSVTTAHAISPANGHPNCTTAIHSHTPRDSTWWKIISGDVAASATVNPTSATMNPSVLSARTEMPGPYQQSSPTMANSTAAAMQHSWTRASAGSGRFTPPALGTATSARITAGNEHRVNIPAATGASARSLSAESTRALAH